MPNDLTVTRWEDIQDAFFQGSSNQRGDLLLGNGFSINIWENFRYESLLSESHLQGSSRRAFSSETNFEKVLADLGTTVNTLNHIDPDQRIIPVLNDISDEIRESLFKTVQTVHPTREKLTQAKLPAKGAGEFSNLLKYINEELSRYWHIYTTNYDLICYWAAVDGIADHFPGSNPFSEDKAYEFLEHGMPHAFFLHGGLHLWTRTTDEGDREEGKHTATGGLSLLETVGTLVEKKDRLPLFISEGTAQEKQQRIRESPYLSFCRRIMEGRNAPLTVLGHSLSEADQHIRSSIEQQPERLVAIGIWVPPGRNAKDYIRQEALEIRGRLKECNNVVFFDSSEHPLTSPACKIK